MATDGRKGVKERECMGKHFKKRLVGRKLESTGDLKGGGGGGG